MNTYYLCDKVLFYFQGFNIMGESSVLVMGYTSDGGYNQPHRNFTSYISRIQGQ